MIAVLFVCHKEIKYQNSPNNIGRCHCCHYCSDCIRHCNTTANHFLRWSICNGCALRSTNAFDCVEYSAVWNEKQKMLSLCYYPMLSVSNLYKRWVVINSNPFVFFLLLSHQFQKSKNYRIVSAVVDRYTINTYYVWHPTWNGMRPVSNVKNVDDFWTKAVNASYAMGKPIAHTTILGKHNTLRIHFTVTVLITSKRLMDPSTQWR